MLKSEVSKMETSLFFKFCIEQLLLQSGVVRRSLYSFKDSYKTFTDGSRLSITIVFFNWKDKVYINDIEDSNKTQSYNKKN